MVFELGDFRQNYRRYVRSYDPDQMHDGTSVPGVSACQPYQYLGNAQNGSADQEGAILPCGQISQSFFNDTYALSLGDGTPLAIDVSPISVQFPIFSFLLAPHLTLSPST